ncbi:unnamed protein product [Microthlaspi erraticum]|uniref:Integrase catalytic domain-containing protein n=1 Tax=Microthlaspi erraticum TaxID=1685480 RepID=A0A6D2JLK7_9BRAS|nr:unnamed protein product [Microthlaspi erraticum]
MISEQLENLEHKEHLRNEEGHVKKDCYARKRRMESEHNGEAAVMVDTLHEIDALTISDQDPKDRWIIDSGCSYHMTSRRDWFEDYEDVTGGQVMLADDRTVRVEGIGTIRINANGGTVKRLQKVRYVPNLKRNLISVSTLDLQGFKHEGSNGKIKFYKNEKLTLQGTLCGSLYLLDGKTVAGDSNAAVSKDDTALWHSRLGHMSMKNLKILVQKGFLDKKKISDLDFCESCVMGKNKRLSFSIVKHNTEEVLKYVHSDLWGSPNVHLSISRKQYFLSIIDDYSRKVNKRVKCLRTDNGLEFCNSVFDGFCKQHGIERHRTCAYTPQQNGVAERMNRTIMEKMRCLLNESGLEEKFWAEAMATSVYLINRTPSSANDANIPEQLWLNKEPGYLHLRRSGSVVYVHIDQGKLKPRALKGVFIGYPQGVKGYKVWLLEDKKCVVSRNAVFTEGKLYKDLLQDKESAKNQQDSVKQVKSGVIIEDAETQEDLTNYQLARDRDRRTIRLPTRYQDDEQVLAFALSVAEVIDSDEPKTYQEALRSSNWVKWE